MAEAIGLGASIAGLATFGAQIVTSLRIYASAYSRASHKINGLSSDLALINSILTDLGVSITKYEQKFHITATNFVGAKASCERNFERLRMALKVAKKDEAEGREPKGKDLWKERSVGPWEKLMFALGGEEELKTFLQEIESSKSTLQLLLESFKLFILLRLHELNEEQREDIKFLNQKVPVLVMGIRRAGLGNFEPRQRLREQRFIAEPTNIMNVPTLDGSNDQLQGLSVDPPSLSGNVQRTVSNRTLSRGLLYQQTNAKEELSRTPMTSDAHQGPDSSNRMENLPPELSLMSRSISADQNDEKYHDYTKNPSSRFMLNDPPSNKRILEDAISSVTTSNELRPEQEDEEQFSKTRDSNGNQALQDYQMGPMLLEQQKQTRHNGGRSGKDFNQLIEDRNTTHSVLGRQANSTIPINNRRNILQNNHDMPTIPAFLNFKDTVPINDSERRLRHQKGHLPNHRHPIPNLLAESQPQPEAVSASAKLRESIPKKFAQSVTNYNSIPEVSHSRPKNPGILSRGLEQDLQEKRQTPAEGDKHSGIVQVSGNDVRLRIMEESEPSPRSSISPRAPSTDSRSIYEGWLLETPSSPQKQPPFAIFCCSHTPVDFRPDSPSRWFISPFSRDTTILKPRIESPSQPHSALGSLPRDAREEINDLVQDRNDHASREHGWRVAAICAHSPMNASGFSFRKVPNDKEPEKYLVILRGGPKPSSGRETEDLPDRYSNPWRDHPRVDRDVVPFRYKVKSSLSRGYGVERVGRTKNVVYERERYERAPPSLPIKGVLRTPMERFPEEPMPIREGVAPLVSDLDSFYDTRKSDPELEFDSGRERKEDFPEGDGKVRDFDDWERKGPLLTVEPPRQFRRPAKMDSAGGEGFGDRNSPPAMWGEGRHDAAKAGWDGHNKHLLDGTIASTAIGAAGRVSGSVGNRENEPVRGSMAGGAVLGALGAGNPAELSRVRSRSQHHQDRRRERIIVVDRDPSDLQERLTKQYDAETRSQKIDQESQDRRNLEQARKAHLRKPEEQENNAIIRRSPAYYTNDGLSNKPIDRNLKISDGQKSLKENELLVRLGSSGKQATRVVDRDGSVDGDGSVLRDDISQTKEDDEKLSDNEARRLMEEFLRGFSADEGGGLAAVALNVEGGKSDMKEDDGIDGKMDS